MDWSFMDKVLFVCMFAFMKAWRFIVPGLILGLIGIGYWIGS